METKVKQTSENDNIDFSGFISGAAYMFPRDNGNPAGYGAIRQSLQRSGYDPYGKANEVLNNKCLPLPVTQSNTFKAEQNSFERLSECLHVNHGGIAA